jgi:hypothetical protein
MKEIEMPTESVEYERHAEHCVIRECAEGPTNCAFDCDRVPNANIAEKSIRDRVVDFWIAMGQLNG